MSGLPGGLSCCTILCGWMMARTFRVIEFCHLGIKTVVQNWLASTVATFVGGTQLLFVSWLRPHFTFSCLWVAADRCVDPSAVAAGYVPGVHELPVPGRWLAS